MCFFWGVQDTTLACIAEYNFVFEKKRVIVDVSKLISSTATKNIFSIKIFGKVL